MLVCEVMQSAGQNKTQPNFSISVLICRPSLWKCQWGSSLQISSLLKSSTWFVSFAPEWTNAWTPGQSRAGSCFHQHQISLSPLPTDHQHQRKAEWILFSEPQPSGTTPLIHCPPLFITPPASEVRRMQGNQYSWCLSHLLWCAVVVNAEFFPLQSAPSVTHEMGARYCTWGRRRLMLRWRSMGSEGTSSWYSARYWWMKPFDRKLTYCTVISILPLDETEERCYF